MRTSLVFSLFLYTISSINVYTQEIGFTNTKIITIGAENKVEINFDLTATSQYKFFDIEAKVNISGSEYNLSEYIGSSVIGVIGPMQVKGLSTNGTYGFGAYSLSNSYISYFNSSKIELYKIY